jgi:hypothetical protein
MAIDDVSREGVSNEAIVEKAGCVERVGYISGTQKVIEGDPVDPILIGGLWAGFYNSDICVKLGKPVLAGIAGTAQASSEAYAPLYADANHGLGGDPKIIIPHTPNRKREKSEKKSDENPEDVKLGLPKGIAGIVQARVDPTTYVDKTLV